MNKVAQVTLLFWLMKILATTLGETLGDPLSMTMGLGYASGIWITLAGFLIVLIIQLSRRSFLAPLYWLVIVDTTTLGTEISDFMDRSLGWATSRGPRSCWLRCSPSWPCGAFA